jgi:tight adherence protein C
MTAILILGLVLLASSVAFVIRALAVPRGTGGSVQRIGRYGFVGTDAEASDAEAEQRWLDRLATSIGTSLSRQFDFLSEERLRARLISAGLYSTTPARMLGYQLMLAVALLCIWIWLGQVAGYGPFKLVLGGVVGVTVGWLIPSGYIWARRRERHEEIEYALPEMIDLLVVTVEAGVSLAGGLRIAAREISGPLGEELRLTLQEQNLGLSGRDALENLAIRADTTGVRIFVRGIIQGETLGMSIGQVMRNLALEMRKQRKAAAEERAQKAPIKLIFPLVFLIFPAMMIVLVVPALLNLANYFK